MFTLWTLIESSLLCLNAVCILHEERFLAKCKFSYSIFAFNATMFIFFCTLFSWLGPTGGPAGLWSTYGQGSGAKPHSFHTHSGQE